MVPISDSPHAANRIMKEILRPVFRTRIITIRMAGNSIAAKLENLRCFKIFYEIRIVWNHLNGHWFLNVTAPVLYEYFNDPLTISCNNYFDGTIQPQSPSRTCPFYLVFLKAIYQSHLAIWQS